MRKLTRHFMNGPAASLWHVPGSCGRGESEARDIIFSRWGLWKQGCQASVYSKIIDKNQWLLLPVNVHYGYTVSIKMPTLQLLRLLLLPLPMRKHCNLPPSSSQDIWLRARGVGTQIVQWGADLSLLKDGKLKRCSQWHSCQREGTGSPLVLVPIRSAGSLCQAGVACASLLFSFPIETNSSITDHIPNPVYNKNNYWPKM